MEKPGILPNATLGADAEHATTVEPCIARPPRTATAEPPQFSAPVTVASLECPTLFRENEPEAPGRTAGTQAA